MVPRYEYIQAKLDFNRPKTKKELKEKLGDKCVNCGSNVAIEYHHIVPLSLGGTNNITNIVPLCFVCHKIVHDNKNLRVIDKTKFTGRPRRKLPENYKSILCSYFSGMIGRKECQEYLNLKPQMKLHDVMEFKEYKKEHKIKAYKNRIDILNTNGKRGHWKIVSNKFIVPHMAGKEVIATIDYENGERFIRYNDRTTEIVKNLEK